MAAMALRHGVCPESQAIQRNLSMVVDRVAKSAGPLWLSQKLQEEGFISAERAAEILSTLGTSSSDKVSSLMEAVESRIKCNRDHIEPFRAFLTMLQNEPSLNDVADMLEGDYQELVGNEYAVDACDSSEDRTPLLSQNEVSISRETHIKPSQARHSRDAKFERPLCMCCSTISVAAVMTAGLMIIAVASFAPNNDKMKVKHSLEQGTTPAVVPSLFTFLWTIIPTVLMFAIIIISYCRRWYLRKRLSPVYMFYTIVTVLIYIAALFMGLWKLNSGSGLMTASALIKGPSKPFVEFHIDFVLCSFYLIQYIRIFEPVIFVLLIYIPEDIRPGRFCHLLYMLIEALLWMGVSIISVFYIWYNSTISLTPHHLPAMIFGASVGICVPPYSTMDDIHSSMKTLSTIKLFAIFIPALYLWIVYYIIGSIYTGTMEEVCCLAGLILVMLVGGGFCIICCEN